MFQILPTDVKVALFFFYVFLISDIYIMKNLIIISGLVLTAAFTSCGPPAESREYMHSRAKTISDSMANLIQSALDEAKMPTGAPPVIAVPDTAASKTGSAISSPK